MRKHLQSGSARVRKSLRESARVCESDEVADAPSAPPNLHHSNRLDSWEASLVDLGARRGSPRICFTALSPYAMTSLYSRDTRCSFPCDERCSLPYTFSMMFDTSTEATCNKFVSVPNLVCFQGFLDNFEQN